MFSNRMSFTAADSAVRARRFARGLLVASFTMSP